MVMMQRCEWYLSNPASHHRPLPVTRTGDAEVYQRGRASTRVIAESVTEDAMIVRHRAAPGRALRRLCALALLALAGVRAAGAQPVASRSVLPAPALMTDQRLRALGNVTLCDAVRCEQGAALELAVAPFSRWRISAGGVVRRSVLAERSPTITGRRIDLVLGTAARNAWIGRGAGERTAYDSLGSWPANWLEYGAALRWRSVSATVQVARGSEWAPGAARSVTRVRAIPRLDSLSGHVRVDTISETVRERSDADAARWSSTELRVDWRSEHWRMSAVLGRIGAPASGSSVWSRGETELRLDRRVAVLASVGTAPLVTAPPTTRARWTATLGVTAATGLFARTPGDRPRSADAGAAFLVVPLGGARYRILVRLPGATRVELASDLTAWQPMEMRRTGDGRWSVDLAASVGAHRLNVRIDGGSWIAPPGLGVDTDDFGGATGVVVIQ
jgi:hypothetical protein